MRNITCTHHGAVRMQQRGRRHRDIEIIRACGTQVEDEVWMLLDRDANAVIRELKQYIRDVERLKNSKLVERDGLVHTVYTPRAGNRKRTLRRARERGV